MQETPSPIVIEVEETPQNDTQALSPENEKGQIVLQEAQKKPKKQTKQRVNPPSNDELKQEEPVTAAEPLTQKIQSKTAPAPLENTQSTVSQEEVSKKRQEQEDAFIIINDETPPQAPQENTKQPQEKKEAAKNDLKQKEVLPKETEEKKVYAIDTSKIFIRTKPIDGKRVDVWARGHRFVAGEERNVNGRIWVSIVEDCKQNDECEKLEKPLWVSKKYIKNINNLSLN